jgi:hypothetical protein
MLFLHLPQCSFAARGFWPSLKKRPAGFAEMRFIASLDFG